MCKLLQHIFKLYGLLSAVVIIQAFVYAGTEVQCRARKRPEYMNKLTRLEVSTIFKTRTRMLDVKNNFRGMYTNLTCRGCGKTDETQQHVLEKCETIHLTEKSKINQEEIFAEEPNELKKTAEEKPYIM